MKSKIFVLTFVVMFSAHALAQNSTRYVKIKKENLRQTPNGSKIMDLPAGTGLNVLETKGQWTKVQMTGWIWTESLTDDKTRVDGYTIGISHILVKTQAQADEIVKELASGKSFETLAKKHSKDEATASEGGKLGRYQRGDLVKSLEDAAFGLEIGKYSQPVKTELGFHILKRYQ